MQQLSLNNGVLLIPKSSFPGGVQATVTLTVPGFADKIVWSFYVQNGEDDCRSDGVSTSSSTSTTTTTTTTTRTDTPTPDPNDSIGFLCAQPVSEPRSLHGHCRLLYLQVPFRYQREKERLSVLLSCSRKNCRFLGHVV